MAANSKIEWTDHTFNPWVGCTKISPACDHCYAQSWAKRTGHAELWKGTRRITSDANWRKPIKWNADAAKTGARPRVFCASLADVFDSDVSSQWRSALFEMIRTTSNMDWLLLTKRIGNAKRMLPPDWGSGYRNVWIGSTIANQEEADRDIPKLLATPARVRFLSCEPLLGSLDVRKYLGTIRYETQLSEGSVAGIDWVIAGGESGGKARPSHPDWFRSLRDQCAAAGVAFHFKQWGEFLPRTANETDPCLPDVPDSKLYWSDGQKWDRFDGQRGGVEIVARVGKKAAGRMLDGVIHDAFPVPA